MSEVFTFENLYNAYLYTRKGKRDKRCVARYENNALEMTMILAEKLQSKTYQLGDYYEFKIYEPKERIIKAPPFRDRVVQRCLCEQTLEPAIERHLIYDTYACRRGKGTHAALDRAEEFMKKFWRHNGLSGWIIKGDISKYFYSISHEILKKNLYPLLKEYDVWWLIIKILNSADNPGLPLGNQSSQWFANFYLSNFDHYVKEMLRVKYYIRYMDDWIALVETKDKAKYILEKMKEYLWEELRLETNKKTQIFPLKNGVDFLGFHLYITDTGKVIRKIRRDSKERMKRKLKAFKVKYELGLISKEDIDRSYESWKGHARHGSCYRLIQSMDKLYNDIFEGDGRDGTSDNKLIFKR
ncbi:reverse transcriptase domain-containing protein [Clostridium sp.]|uniref:reverse transcriptase domain-containing protein n=1 Tax=Clostridium sp. TaxID=1506 RepID=UPI003A334766